MATNKKKTAIGRVLTQVQTSQTNLTPADGSKKSAQLSADLETYWTSTKAEDYKVDITGIVDDVDAQWTSVEDTLQADYNAQPDDVEEDSPEAKWPNGSRGGSLPGGAMIV